MKCALCQEWHSFTKLYNHQSSPYAQPKQVDVCGKCAILYSKTLENELSE